jgi:hypothetical protein
MKTAKANQTVTSTKDNRLSIEKDCNLGKLQNLIRSKVKARSPKQIAATEYFFTKGRVEGSIKILSNTADLLEQELGSAVLKSINNEISRIQTFLIRANKRRAIAAGLELKEKL